MKKVNESAMNRAKRLINDYCQEEFGHNACFDNIAGVGVAFTTTEKHDIPIHASVDLVHFKLIRTLGKKVIECRKFKSLTELCEKALKYLDFCELTYVSDEQEEAYFCEVMK